MIAFGLAGYLATIRSCLFPLWRQNQQLWIRCCLGIVFSHSGNDVSHVPLAISWKVQFRSTYGSWCLYVDMNYSFAFSHAHFFFEHILWSSTRCTHFELYSILVPFLLCVTGKRIYIYIIYLYTVCRDIFQRWLLSASWLCSEEEVRRLQVSHEISLLQASPARNCRQQLKCNRQEGVMQFKSPYDRFFLTSVWLWPAFNCLWNVRTLTVGFFKNIGVPGWAK